MNCGGITSDGGKKMSRSEWTKLALWYKKNKNTYELQLEKNIYKVAMVRN